MTAEAMLAGMRMTGLILASLAAAPAAAQLVIDRSAPIPYPMPPKVEPEAEDEKAKAPPSYSGDRIRIAPGCDEARLSALGMVCGEASPCEMRLELTAAKEAGEAVVAIGDIYSASATVESLILRTEDGGAAWVEAAERIAGAALDEIHFSGGQHGWIVARETVGGGQHPFLLATGDAGKSWRRWAIDEDEDYRGAVLQLRFDSPDHGFLIVERSAGAADPYELRETFNGGRSWSLRQVTADRPALRGSRRRIPEAVVRVQEDSGEDLYAVEERDGESWTVLGNFLGSAGSCPAR